jgi:hypothetical protein
MSKEKPMKISYGNEWSGKISWEVCFINHSCVFKVKYLH